jgi:hypothetical protein
MVISSVPPWSSGQALLALVIAAAFFAVGYVVSTRSPVLWIVLSSLVAGVAVALPVRVVSAYNRLLRMTSPLYSEANTWRMRCREAEKAYAHMRASRDEWRAMVTRSCWSGSDVETPAELIGRMEGTIRGLQAANKALHARHADDVQELKTARHENAGLGAELDRVKREWYIPPYHNTSEGSTRFRFGDKEDGDGQSN